MIVMTIMRAMIMVLIKIRIILIIIIIVPSVEKPAFWQGSSCEMLHNDDDYCIMAFCCALSYPTLTLQNLIISRLIRMMKMITI